MTNGQRQFQIAVAEDAFQLMTSGALTAGIWMRCGSELFPDEDWNDFPVSILTWWLREVSDLESGTTEESECCFMDGPFSFRIERTDDPLQWQVVCVTHTIKVREVNWGRFSRDDVREAIVGAADAVIAYCRREGIEPNGIDSLTYARTLVDMR